MKPIDAMLEVLRSEGVDKVFGNTGTTELPFVEALSRRPEFDFVLGLHEGSVVAMADGYARATGRAAFVSLHAAAGLANGLSGLLNANRSRTPMVVTAGQQDRRHLRTDPMLSGDLVALARPAVKHAVEVHHGYDLAPAVRRAFQLAEQPPAGPVFLSIPMDLLEEQADVDPPPPKSTLAGLGPAAGVRAAAELLATARRPAIIAGDGIGREGAVAELVAVAEALGAITFAQPMYDRVNFPTTHPLYGGMLDARNSEIRAALDGCDTVFIVGARAFTAHHYSPGSAIAEGTVVVQLDSDCGELGRNIPVALGLLGGISVTLTALAAEVTGRVADRVSRTVEIGRNNEAARGLVRKRARACSGDAPMDPLAAVHAIVAGLPDDTVVVEEAITCGLLLRTVLPRHDPRSFVHTVGGGLGSGIGAAIGTALADPGRPVVAVLGDGCAMFGLQGLWTAAHRKLPVVFVVMNNGEYRTLKETTDRRGTALDGFVGLDLGPPDLDFTRAAEFFGMTGVRATSTRNLAELVAKATVSGEPVLIDVPIISHGQGQGSNPTSEL